MLEIRSRVDVSRVWRFKIVLLTFLVVSFMAAAAADAWATLEIQSYNDPAGDKTVMSYRLLNADGQPVGGGIPDPFTLTEGEPKSFGPSAGTYIWKAVPLPGWQVSDIQCLNRFRPANPGEFTIDVTNGQVTVVHGATDDQYCAFTNRKISASGGSGSGQGASSGVSPTVPGGPGTLPKGPALLRVAAGLRFARATVRISRTSLIKAQLLKGERVVGSKRVKHRAGTHVVKVSLTRKAWRRFKRQGLKRVTLTLKIVVVGSNRSTKVFRYGVVVRL